MSLSTYHTKRLLAVGFAACTIALSACDSTVIVCQEDCPADGNSQLPNIVETATAAGSFTTLLGALESAGLNTVLADDSQSFTVFAPTDDAFAALGEEALNALTADSEALTDTLLYHVLPGSVNAETAIGVAGSDDPVLLMENFKAATLTLDGESLLINGATVIQTDIVASNGVIHVIDAVLTPPEELAPLNLVQTADNAGNFTTLLAALDEAGLTQVLSDSSQQYTVFAPTDDAFAALGEEAVNALLADAEALNSTLLYHVLSGSVDSATAVSLAGTSINMANEASAQLSLNDGTLRINDANVIATDIVATNGVIHVIDAVLTPPNVDVEPELVDLAATLAGLENYSSLLAAVQSAGLDTVLSNPESTFTIFAPNNAAFEAAEADIQAALVDNPDALEAVLLGHVLPDTIVDAAAALASDGTQVTMANGANRTITVVDDTVSIDGATVVEVDINASNGIIHGIDTVILDSPE